MQGVQGVDGGGIPDESSDDSILEVGGDMLDMDNPGRGVLAKYFLNEITCEGRPTELPGGGMPRPIGDKDGNAGAFTAPACP